MKSTKGDEAETNFPENGVTIAVEIEIETRATYVNVVHGGRMIPRAGEGIETSLKAKVVGTTVVVVDTTEEVEIGVLLHPRE